MESGIVGIIGILMLLILIILGVHIGIALLAVGFIGLVYVHNVDAALSLTLNSFYATASTYSFTVLPLFIMLGYFAGASGVAEGGYRFAAKWFSQLRASLYVVTTGACALMAAACGDSLGPTMSVGKIILPEMLKRGYDQKLSVGCLVASGTLGVMIPPSIVFVLYGIVTEESIGKLLLAGVGPGLLTAAMFMLGMSVLVKWKPQLAPPPVKYTWKERFQVVPGTWGLVLLFGSIMGGIYTGVFTPTEAGAIGAVLAVILFSLKVKKGFFTEAKKVAWEGALTHVMIYFIIVTSIVFSRFLTLSGATNSMTDGILGGTFSPWMVFALFIFICIIMGMFMSATACVLLIAPVAHSALVPLGFDGIYIGVIMVKLWQVAVMSPPVALNVYAVKALVPEMKVGDIFRGVMPFVFLDCITLVILLIFPQISLWLPSKAMG